jgi:hypothetical protein
MKIKTNIDVLDAATLLELLGKRMKVGLMR